MNKLSLLVLLFSYTFSYYLGDCLDDVNYDDRYGYTTGLCDYDCTTSRRLKQEEEFHFFDPEEIGESPNGYYYWGEVQLTGWDGQPERDYTYCDK